MHKVLHIKYTNNVLNKFVNIDDKSKKQILIGCVANDLCEFTQEYSDIVMRFDLLLKSNRSNFLFDSSPIYESLAIYQSHYGKLSALHSMAQTRDIPAKSTRKDILKLLAFLEHIVLNGDTEMLLKSIDKFEDILGSQIQDVTFKVYKLLDTKNIFKAKHRAIGMILHIIEDSYTKSHCRRVRGLIKTFYYYKDQSNHSDFDVVQNKNEDVMKRYLKAVLKKLLKNKSAKLEYKDIFRLSASATPSFGGDLKDTYGDFLDLF